MDLYFATGDVFDAEIECVPENVLAEKDRREYSAKICDIQSQPNALVTDEEKFCHKQAADLAYKNKNFKLAIELYETYLREMRPSGGTLRDVLESVIRSYMALEDLKNAERYCEQLIKVGHAQNVLLLRIELAVMKNDWSNQTGSLICQVIEIHPWLDRLWLHLAQWYRTRNDLEKEYWCLEKASQTESSQNIANIQNLMDDNTLDSELKEQIRLKILQNISVPKQVRKVEQVDFVDLGSSVQIREQEEKMKNINTSFEDSEYLIRMFENKWFSI